MMEPNKCTSPDSAEEAGAEDGVSWVSVSPVGLCRVHPKLTQQHCPRREPEKLLRPQLGSLCHVRVHLKTEAGDIHSVAPGEGCQTLTEDRTTSSTQSHRVLQVPLGTWTTLTMGEGQCDVTEACLERMGSGDKCEILLVPDEACAEVLDDSAHSFLATVELKTFTPGKESWELTAEEKVKWVRSHKERGSARFRSGNLWGAADSYCRALKLLIPLYGHVKKSEGLQFSPESPVLSAIEYKTIKAELHSNLSLCQLKLKQPERARANASKATELHPNGDKAWYRLGQACLMVSELEDARTAFNKLLELQPDSSVAIKALKEVAMKEKESNKELANRLSKMFN